MTAAEIKLRQKSRRNKCFAQIRDIKYLRKYGPRVLNTTDELVTQDNIKAVLERNGYTFENCSWSQKIAGYGVKGYVVDYDLPCRMVFIAVDNDKCYDKTTRCPVKLEFPIKQERLFKALMQIGSPAGYEISTKYDYLDENPFEHDKADFNY
mgnify:CR=1 FL=1